MPSSTPIGSSAGRTFGRLTSLRPSGILKDGAPLFGEGGSPLLVTEVSGPPRFSPEDRGTWLSVAGGVGPAPGCFSDPASPTRIMVAGAGDFWLPFGERLVSPPLPGCQGRLTSLWRKAALPVVLGGVGPAPFYLGLANANPDRRSRRTARSKRLSPTSERCRFFSVPCKLGFNFIQRLLPPFAKRACARAPGVVWGRDCQSCDLSVRQLP